MLEDSSIDATLFEIRRRLSDGMLKVFCVLSLPALAASLYRVTDTGWQSVMFVHIAVVILVWCLYLFRKRVSFWIQTILLLNMMYFLGGGALLNYGLSSSATLPLLVFVVMVTFFFGLRAGMAALAASILLLVVFTLTITQRWLKYTIDFNVYGAAVSSWLFLTLAFGLLAGMVVIVAHRLYSALIDALSTAQRQTDEIRQRAVELQAEIHERKRAESQKEAALEAIRESEDKFSKVFQLSPHSLAITSVKDGVFLDVNQAFLSLTGLTREDVIGFKSKDLNAWIDDGLIQKIKARIDEGKAISLMPISFRRKSGEIRDTLFSTTIILIGGLPYVLSVAFDITEHKEMQKRLEESRANLNALIESTGDMIWSVDSDYRLLTYNGTFLRRFQKNYEIEIHIGDIPPDDLAKVWLPLFRRAMTEGPFLQNYTLPDGGLLELSLNPIVRDADVIGVSVFGKDIAERVRLENQLRQAQKMEAIGTLAGGIAHDFNNILGGIMGYIELIQTRFIREDHPSHKYLAGAYEGALRAKDLVAQMMTFSRQQEQRQKPLALVLLLKEALKLLRSSIPATIEIQQHISETKAFILADPSQIHQIIMNLCINAAHAMKEKGGVLDIFINKVAPGSAEHIRHSDLKADTEYLELVVHDTGHGIAPEILDRIYDPFFTTKKVGEGTGLGLAVVYGIVKSHDGVIHVESKPDQGTTFRIYFPAIAPREKMEPVVREPQPGGHESIILVDDEQALTYIFRMQLENLGYTVCAFNDPLDAIAAIKEDPGGYDLLITDLTMPHMTGVELAYEVGQIRQDLPAILCSGNIEMDRDELLKSTTIRQVIMKPVSINELAQVLRQILNKR